MAYETFEERYARQEKEREQLRLEQQVQKQKLMKTIGAGVLVFFTLTFLLFSLFFLFL